MAGAAAAVPVRLPETGFAVSHGPAALKLTDGRVLVCWYTGTTERNRDSQIVCSERPETGQVWSEPRVVTGEGERASGAARVNKTVGNVTLHQGKEDTVWIIYGVVQSWRVLGIELCGGWYCGRTDVKMSIDGGRTWGTGMRLDDRVGALPRSRPFDLSGGETLIPIYRESGNQSVVRVSFQSEAPGLKFRAVEGIKGPKGLMQASIAQTKDGRVVAYFRDQKRRGVFMSQRSDKGAWTNAVQTGLLNPGAAVEAFSDGNGQIVLVHNPDRESRSILAIAVSPDGTAFSEPCTFAGGPDGPELGYPSATNTGPGQWLVVYSVDKSRIEAVTLTQAAIDSCLKKN